MKKSYLLISAVLVLALCATLALAESRPDLTGTWKGTATVWDSASGLLPYTGSDGPAPKMMTTPVTFMFHEQKGGMFYGEKFPGNDRMMQEHFTGSIRMNGTIVMAPQNRQAVMVGQLMDNGVLEIQYVHPGPKNHTAILFSLRREK